MSVIPKEKYENQYLSFITIAIIFMSTKFFSVMVKDVSGHNSYPSSYFITLTNSSLYLGFRCEPIPHQVRFSGYVNI